MRTKGSARELEARRRRAAEFFQERKPLAEVTRLVGASLSRVKRWKRAWRDGGVAALAAKPHLEFEWLPAYAPELNPVEPRWSHTKFSDLAHYVPYDTHQLKGTVRRSLAKQTHNSQLK